MEMARLTVARNARDGEDLLFLLDILGLIRPQPQYKPMDREDRLAQDRLAYKRKKAEAAAKENARLARYRVKPSEFGE